MIRGRRYEFGVSGLLYKSNLLFYDRQSDSLWSQLLSEAVTGPLAGTRLAILPAENTAWDAWLRAHPNTLVLSFKTGYSRNYNEDLYATYPLSRKPALLVSAAGITRIYPFSELKRARSPLIDHFAGHAVTIVFDRRSQTARVDTAPPEEVTYEVTYFVSFFDDLKVFYPRAEVYRARSK